ncbi:MAG TPA: carbohydrate kinase family protein [Vicinamibacterales bacterium]|nr:carbohydrate kinase family protein [Vicinamibacterales bacterium]
MPLALPPIGSTTADVFAFGESSLDFVVSLPTAPPVDGKVTARGFEMRAGGQAATVAVGLARQGWRSAYGGALGDDRWGRDVRAALAAASVRAEIVTRRETPSRTAVVLVDLSTGQRTILEHRDPRLDLHVDDLPAAAVAGARVLSVDATDARAALALTRVAREHRVPSVLDVDQASDASRALLAEVDIVVVGQAMLRELTGTADPGDGLARLARLVPAPLVIVTLGPDGSLARVADREIGTRAFDVGSVRDTTGAGDAFRAGLIGGWLAAGADAQLADVLRFANVCAALNCRAIGAQTGLPTRAEIQALL